MAKLTPSDGIDNDNFGWSVAMSADGWTVVAGSLEMIGSNFDEGSAYVFVKPSSGWASETQTAKLTASDDAAGDQWACRWRCPRTARRCLGGAPTGTVGANDEQGAVYVFTRPSSGWVSGTESARLTAPGGAASDQLGTSVAVSADGATVLAGAPHATVEGNPTQGAAYIPAELANPSLSVSGPSAGTAGQAISASSVSASLSGGSAPTGTMTFKAFGPQPTPPSDCTTGGTTVGTAAVSRRRLRPRSHRRQPAEPTRLASRWRRASRVLRALAGLVLSVRL